MELKVTGTIKTITFHNEDNGYSVVRLTLDGTQPSPSLWLTKQTQLTAVGTLLNPQKGERLSLYGTLVEHPKFGTQMAFTRYEKEAIYSKEGLVEYLSSDLFKGVGKVTAQKIVQAFKDKTIETLTQNPEKIHDVKGLKLKDPKQFIETLKAHHQDEAQRIAFYDVGLSPKLINTILKTYQHEAYDLVKKNPYQLIEDIPGIGFERADVIAKRFNIAPDDPRRLRAYIMHEMRQEANRHGHTHLKIDALLDTMLERLASDDVSVSREALWQHFKHLEQTRQIIKDDEMMTLPRYYQSEQRIAKVVKHLASEPLDLDEDAFLEAFEKIQTDVIYTASQTMALKQLLKQRITILNGGPGTGKTTLVQGLIEVYKHLHDIKDQALTTHIKLMAPTGKAAKRLFEATNVEATTIHRFLGYKHDLQYTYDRHHHAPGKLFIIDEASMIDVLLAAALLEALPDDAHVVFVGDDGQLPSVGPGQVLYDLMAANVPVVTLSTIHRQALHSPIIPFARAIREGELPPLKTVQPSLFFIPLTPDEVHERTLNILKYWLEEGLDIEQDIQVLVPLYKGPLGIDAFNASIQNYLHPNPSKTLKHFDETFVLGDKVLQLINRPDDGVMNGDQGLVVALDETKQTLTVSFQGIFVNYEKDDLDQLRLAYAISVHKAQGSGFKVVIIPLFKAYWVMLKRKLIYTAITRATDHLILCGDLSLIAQTLRFDDPPRQTKLTMKCTTEAPTIWAESLPPIDLHRIDDPSIPFDTLGEPTEPISPYDFMKEE